MDRIVDIATDDLHLSAYRGFLVVSLDRQEQGGWRSTIFKPSSCMPMA